jgi:hypothetical protein
MRYGMALRQLSSHRIVQALLARSAVWLSFNTYQRIRQAQRGATRWFNPWNQCVPIEIRCISIRRLKFWCIKFLCLYIRLYVCNVFVDGPWPWPWPFFLVRTTCIHFFPAALRIRNDASALQDSFFRWTDANWFPSAVVLCRVPHLDRTGNEDILLPFSTLFLASKATQPTTTMSILVTILHRPMVLPFHVLLAIFSSLLLGRLFQQRQLQ